MGFGEEEAGDSIERAQTVFGADFLAMLNGGRVLVVEYKDAYIAQSADTDEKRTVGELREGKSNGKDVFVLAEESVDGADTRSQILGKLGP